MDRVISFLNNRYLIAVVVGLFVLSFARGLVRR
jgi:hypothetical protein